jgi:hypothetical protein
MDRVRRSEQGRAQLLLLVMLLAACGAGAWNYQRNLRAEQAAEAARPLAGYATGDLEALADAYRQEIDAYGTRYAKRREARTEVREQAYFDDQVREFERVQRAAGKQRDAGSEVAVREAALRDVEAELAARGPGESEWERHLRRLTSF